MTTIFGMPVTRPLPESTQPVEGIAIVKCLDGDGELVWHLSATEGLSSVEALGMLEAAAFTYKQDLHEAFLPDDDDEEK